MVRRCKSAVRERIYQRYNRGIPRKPSKGWQLPPRENRHDHLQIRPEIFKGDLDFRFDTLVQRFREMAFVTRNVQIRLVDERADQEMTFLFEGGIPSFVRYPQSQPRTLHRSSTSKRKSRTSASKWPCSTPTPTPNRSIPLPTRSTPSTAERT